jgi:hypothetical protein
MGSGKRKEHFRKKSGHGYEKQRNKTNTYSKLKEQKFPLPNIFHQAQFSEQTRTSNNWQ